jgi:hypothetical protein
MPKKAVFVTVHGMGEVDKDYFIVMREAMRERLGARKWNSVVFKAIQYQPELQPNEDQYLGAVQNKVSGHWLRKLMINGFADAGSLEYSRSTPDGPYQNVQKIIYGALGEAFAEAGSKALPVIVLAHSLGCEVVSNYIWDANKPDDKGSKHGVWFDPPATTSDNDFEFRKLKTLKRLITTGCNIPVFIAGLKYTERYPIYPPNAEFQWENYYDKDDVLGYPLADLSDLYAERVKDFSLSVGNIFTGWNPLSHMAYWESRALQDTVASHLSAAIG